MIYEEYDDEEFDYDNAILELKKNLFEICKDNFDSSSALDELISKHGSLVVDVFGDNYFDVMSELADFYEFNDYENPENEECRTFKNWSEYFCELQRKELSQIIFDLMKTGTSVEDIFAAISNEYKKLVKNLSITNVNELKDFLEYNEYQDDFLLVEQSLSDWKSFFDNDEFCLYSTCTELIEQNEQLLKKIEDIRSIIGRGEES